MPHTGPLNSIAKQAVASAALAVQAYLDQLTALLMSTGGAFNYKTARSAAEELRYIWVVDTSKKLNKDVQSILDALKQENVVSLKPIIDKLDKLGGQKTLLPGSFSLTAQFNLTWDADVWKAIDASRAQWHSLSESLWRITDGAQTSSLALMEKASREGLAFNKVKGDLGALLTEKGAASMEYNVRRLWATELRRDRIVANQTTWQSLGVIQEIRLSRSAYADESCEICGNAIGWNASDVRIVSIDSMELPPYHPWCKCESRPVEPTVKQMKTYLDKKYGP